MSNRLICCLPKRIAHKSYRSSTQTMRQSLSTCVSLGAANSELLTGLLDRITEIEKTYSRSNASIQDDNSTLVSEEGSTSDVVRPTTSAVTKDEAQPPLTDGTSKLSWQIAPKEGRRCKPWCSCCCHCRKTFVMPCILTNVLGHFILEYSNTGPKCNEQSCLRAKVTSFNLNYNFPWHMSARRLAFIMDYTPIYGTRFNLRLPRPMDWGHLLWGYANDGNIKAIQKLFSEGKASPLDVNLLGESALNYAAQHPHLYRFLVEHGSDQQTTDVNGYKPNELMGDRLLSSELNEGDSLAIRELLDETDFMETRKFTTVHKIVLGIVKRNLQEELEISTASIDYTDSKGRTPLAWATIRNDAQAVSTLITYGANPNICDDAGDSCLHFVRSVEICNILLQAKANVHIANKTLGVSCMQAVCKRFDKPELIDVLHDAGADVNFRDKDKESPLLNAIFKKHTKTVLRLLELGADVDATNKSSWDWSMTFAVTFSYCEIVPKLLEYGASYTSTIVDGKGVAHIAAHFGELKLLRTLATLDLHQMDLSLQDHSGKTAADYMRERTFFPDFETETREAFEIFQRSVLESIKSIDRQDSNASARTEYNLPGAYPA